MSNERELDAIINFLNSGSGFTILTHISPDGDTLGSALALFWFLKELGKPVEVVCSNPVPKIYSFLPGSEDVLFPESAKGYPNVIACDCADLLRAGRAAEIFNNASTTAVIDHHVTNPGFASVNLIDSNASATAEIIYTLFERYSWQINQHAMVCIYTGLSTDTGNLAYSNTTSKSLRIIADFVDRGFDIARYNRLIYRTVPFNKTRLQGDVVSKMKLEADGKIGIAVARRSQMSEFNATDEDCEGIVDCVRDVDTVLIGIFIRESSDGSYKVSLRSKEVGNVCNIAEKYGGGGHVRAAGYTAYDELDKVISTAIYDANEELNRATT